MAEPFGQETLSGVYVERRDGALALLTQETRFDEIVGGSNRGIPYTGYVCRDVEDASYFLGGGPLYESTVGYLQAGGRAVVARRLPGTSTKGKLAIKDDAAAEIIDITAKENGAAASVKITVQVRDYDIPKEGEDVGGANKTWTCDPTGAGMGNFTLVSGSLEVYVDGTLADEAAVPATKYEYSVVLATGVITLGQNATDVRANYKYNVTNGNRHREVVIRDVNRGDVEYYNSTSEHSIAAQINTGANDSGGVKRGPSALVTAEDVTNTVRDDFLVVLAATELAGGVADTTPANADYTTYTQNYLSQEAVREVTDVIVLPQVDTEDAAPVAAIDAWLTSEAAAFRFHRAYAVIGDVQTTTATRAQVTGDVATIVTRKTAFQTDPRWHVSAGGAAMADPANSAATVVAMTCALDAGRDSSLVVSRNKLDRSQPALTFVTALAPQYTEGNIASLEGAGVNFLRNQRGFGVCYSPGKTCASATSDYRDENNQRVMDEVVRLIWREGQKHLGSPSGDGPEGKAAEDAVLRALNNIVTETAGLGYHNGGKVTKNAAKSTLKRLYVDISLLPVGYREFINTSVGFALAL